MKNPLLPLALAALFASPAAAELSANGQKALAEIHVGAAELAKISGEAVDGVTLAVLDAKGDLGELKRFAATRLFIRKFKGDKNTPFPKGGLYNSRYLKAGQADDEKKLVADHLRSIWSGVTFKG